MIKLIYISIVIFAAASCAEMKIERSTLNNILNSIDGDPVVPRSANRIFIKNPANMTGKFGLSARLLRKIIQSISLDGRLGIDEDDTKSDLRLEIVILKYFMQHLEYDDLKRPIKKRMRIIAGARLFDIKKRKTIFLDNTIQSFKVFSDVIPVIQTEDQVADYVLEELAKRITSKTITGWYTEQMTEIERGKLTESEEDE